MPIEIYGEYHLIRGDTVFLIYPFGAKDYEQPTKLYATLAFLYSRGLVPIISPTYIQGHKIEMVRRRIVKRVIAKCDGAVIVGEESMTYNQLLEVQYCKELSIPVFTVKTS